MFGITSSNRNKHSGASAKKRDHFSPNQMIVFSFLSIILIGTVLFLLPVSAEHAPLSPIDALFTAVSATCVTGLSVCDVSKELSPFGQAVLLVLIQLGGLGLMTFSTFFIYLFGRKTSMRNREIIGNTLSLSSSKNIKVLIKRIMLLVVLFELTGTILLTLRFMQHRPFFPALYHGLFHAISAFCNAGFSLYPTSFEPFRNDVTVNLILIGLIVAGGLGFVVLIDLKHRFSWKLNFWRHLSFHSKMVLGFSAALVVAGTGLFFLMEYAKSGTGSFGNLLASFFQAVTARTAGFNTVDIGSLSNATLMLLMVLMFIGAAPGSCGGGIKVTTFGVLMTVLVSRLRGHEDAQIFHRRIARENINKVTIIALMAILIVLIGFVGLLVSEIQLTGCSHGHGPFEQLLFEAISAYGTVGLSLGTTPQLSLIGKGIVILLMFIGRLGPLTIAVALSRSTRQGNFQYATGDIMVG